MKTKIKRRVFEFCEDEGGGIVRVEKNKWRPVTWRTLTKEEVKEWRKFGRRK